MGQRGVCSDTALHCIYIVVYSEYYNEDAMQCICALLYIILQGTEERGEQFYFKQSPLHFYIIDHRRYKVKIKLNIGWSWSGSFIAFLAESDQFQSFVDPILSPVFLY